MQEKPIGVAGVILAGGKSTRMGGGDKALKQLGNKALLCTVIERLQPQVSALVLNSNNNPKHYSDFGIPIIADIVSGQLGPLAGVLSGMQWAQKQGCKWIATVAADTPYFPENLVAELLKVQEQSKSEIVLASTQNLSGQLKTHPTFGIWSVELKENLQNNLQNGVRKIVLWTQQRNCSKAIFTGYEFDPFFNINTPEDLRQAENLMVSTR